MPEIEFVTMASHAEAINGLLYLQGAGWTDVQRMTGPQGQPMPVHFGIGVSILVGWNETNTTYQVTIVMESEDGGEPLMRAEGMLEAGRPPGLPPGADMRSVLAVSGEVVFPKAGGYRVAVMLGDQFKSVSFRVRDPRSQAVGPPSPTSW